MSFINTTVVVTGAARGIGKAYATGFAGLGANVVVTDISDCDAVVEEIKAAGGEAIANGGRYDDIGRVFGSRARPATGFSTELKALAMLAGKVDGSIDGRIFAPYSDDLDLWAAVKLLRKSGEVVVFGHPDQSLPEDCDRELVLQHGEWQLDSINRS